MSLKRKAEEQEVKVAADKKAKALCTHCGPKPATFRGECVPCTNRPLECAKCGDTVTVQRKGGLCYVCRFPLEPEFWPVHRVKQHADTLRSTLVQIMTDLGLDVSLLSVPAPDDREKLDVFQKETYNHAKLWSLTETLGLE
jgi:hypothetical protein